MALDKRSCHIAATESGACYAIPTLDLYRISGLRSDVPLLRERFVPDGTHPNDDGHRRVADRLIVFLKSL